MDAGEAGEGKYRVWLKKEMLDRGIICVVGGGERSHVGSVVVKVPGEEPNVIRLEGHYDDVVLLPIAEEAAMKYGETAVAVGGVHVDDATEEEIELLVKNCRELLRCI